MQSSRWWRGGRSIVIVSVSAVVHLFQPLPSQAQKLGIIPGEYILTPKKHVVAAEATAAAMVADIDVLDQADDGTLLVSPATILALHSDQHGSSQTDESFCAKALKSGRFSSCGPNAIVSFQATSDDPELSKQWGLTGSMGIEASAAWDGSTGSSDVVVAILDTGVDYNHPDLARNIWVNPGEIPGNGVDDDGNGYVDDVHGINTITGSGDPMDDNGHGTHVAGTIGAVGNNGVGVAGVNWNVKMLSVKFLSSTGSGSLFGAIKGLQYLIKLKNRGVPIRITSNSWGGTVHSQPLQEAIQQAAAAGMLFIAAAGNQRNDNDVTPQYPAGYDITGVVSVAAIDSEGNLASFSNYGSTSVDIAAPGVGILSTFPGNRYRSLSGTSMATPHVSGALALLLAREPALSNGALLDRLYASGVPLASLSEVVRTGRRLSAGRMIQNSTTPLPDPRQTEPNCSYAAAEIADLPPTVADAQQVVARGDELTFYTVQLPFDFPWYGSTVRQLTASPNGLVYVGAVPTAMDYQVGSEAPAHTVAVLHTDWISQLEDEGLRVAVEPTQVTFFWRVRSYAVLTGAAAELRVRFRADGTIDQWISLPDPVVESYVRQHATIGIHGGMPSQVTTVASGSDPIRHGLALRYSRSCTVPQLTLSKLSLSGVRRGKPVSFVRDGQQFTLTMTGSGDGVAQVQLGFDGQLCAQPVVLTLSAGFSQRLAKLRLPRQFRVRKLDAREIGQGLSATAVVKRTAQKVSSKRRVRTRSAALFSRACNGLVQGLQRSSK